MISNSVEETIEVAKKISKNIKTGQLFALWGDLGAGKTVFIRGFLNGLGYKKRVNSPTFVLMKIYNIKKHPYIKQVCHIDAYRLNSSDDLESLGVKEYFNRQDTIILIEWPERIKSVLPKDRTDIVLRHLQENKREIKIK